MLIDLESLYNLVLGNRPVHAFLHTYLGATLVVGASWFLLQAAARWKAVPRISLAKGVLGAALGAYSHVVLDSVMHRDIRPFAPFSASNGLLDAVSLDVLHWACLAAGLSGMLIVGVRRLLARGHEGRDR